MKLSLVIPCYNEEGNIPLMYEAVKSDFADAGFDYELVFVNDGSGDGTLSEIKKLMQGDIPVTAVDFSRNFGKESAMFAGLEHAKGEYVTIIDADLQQRPAIALEMVRMLEAEPEYDCVAAYQESRREGGFTAFSKKIFYKIVNGITETELLADASDFRTFRRNMVDAILSLREYHRFGKGIYSWVGFNTKYMPYVVEERASGTSKWSYIKLLKYALGGIIAFTTLPLKIPVFAGVLTMLASLVYLVIKLVLRFGFHDPFTTGGAVIFLILLIGGALLLSTGILGVYLARTYVEVKNRPVYIAKQIISNSDEVRNG